MGKSTISMAIFNSYVSLPEGMYNHPEVDGKRNCRQYFKCIVLFENICFLLQDLMKYKHIHIEPSEKIETVTRFNLPLFCRNLRFYLFGDC